MKKYRYAPPLFLTSKSTSIKQDKKGENKDLDDINCFTKAANDIQVNVSLDKNFQHNIRNLKRYPLSGFLSEPIKIFLNWQITNSRTPVLNMKQIPKSYIEGKIVLNNPNWILRTINITFQSTDSKFSFYKALTHIFFLKELYLDFQQNSDLTNSGLRKLGCLISRNPNLKAISFNFSYNYFISDLGVVRLLRKIYPI